MTADLHRINDRGITLIEVMGSILVFMICAVSLLGVFTASKKISKQSSCAYNAYNLAKQRVELLKTVSFSTVANAGENDVRLNADGTPDEEGDYSRTTVVAANYRGHNDLTQVIVSVYYTFAGEFSPNPMSVTTVILDTTNL